MEWYWIVLIVIGCIIGAFIYFVFGSMIAGFSHRFFPKNSDTSLFDSVMVAVWPVFAPLYYTAITCVYTIRFFDDEEHEVD